MGRQNVLALDFDGVLRSKSDNSSVPGALEAIRGLQEEYEVVIFTARDDLDWVRNWLEDSGFPRMKVTNKKPVAFAYIDDHAVRFDGNWPYLLRSIPERGWND